jgi:Zn-dependent oligopeptidase
VAISLVARVWAFVRFSWWREHITRHGCLLLAHKNPLAGVVPQVVHPVNDGETTVSQYVEKIEGEVALDSYVKAQTSAPEVVKRITELENCLQRLASAILTSSDVDKHPELRTAAEQAKLVLKNRLEVDENRHRFHSELGVIKDELREFKD